MTITIRVKFIESTYAVSSETLFESDTLDADTVLQESIKLAYKAQDEARNMTNRKPVKRLK